jgi:hypothetical protein
MGCAGARPSTSIHPYILCTSPAMSSAAAFISPNNTKRRRRQFVNLRTPPKRKSSSIVLTAPPPRQHRISTGGISLATAPNAQPRTPKRRKRIRTNQGRSIPIGTPRRKPRTPLYPLRSSRNSPPRFEINDSLADDPVGRGSPLPANNNFNYDIDMGFNLDMDVEELVIEPELSVTEKYEAIMEQIRRFIPTYWAILERQPASCTRVSERCFVIEEFDQKSGHLKVSLGV